MFSAARNQVVFWSILLSALTLPTSVAAGDYWRDQCDAFERDLNLLSNIDELFLESRRAATDAAEEAAIEVADLTRSQIAQLRRSARNFDAPDNYPDEIPRAAAIAAFKATLQAIGSAVASSGLSRARGSIGRIMEKARRLQPDLPNVSPRIDANFTDCLEGQRFVNDMDGLIASWQAWIADAELLLESEALCPALDRESYARISRIVLRARAPIVNLGLAMDQASLSGTAHATQFLTVTTDIADTSTQVADILEGHQKRIAQTMKDLKIRKDNLENNLSSIILPAVAATCQTPRTSRNRLAPQYGLPKLGTPASLSSDPSRTPIEQPKMLRVVHHNAGRLERVGDTEVWREYSTRVSSIFEFRQTGYTTDTLTLHDASRGMTWSVPLRSNACMALHQGGQLVNSCFYNVSSISY